MDVKIFKIELFKIVSLKFSKKEYISRFNFYNRYGHLIILISIDPFLISEPYRFHNDRNFGKKKGIICLVKNNSFIKISL